jgi:hypothetical protein
MLLPSYVLPIQMTNWSFSNSSLDFDMSNQVWYYEDSDPGYLNVLSPAYAKDGSPTWINFLFDSRSEGEVSLTFAVGGGVGSPGSPYSVAVYRGPSFNELTIDPSDQYGPDHSFFPETINFSQVLSDPGNYQEGFVAAPEDYRQQTLDVLAQIFTPWFGSDPLFVGESDNVEVGGSSGVYYEKALELNNGLRFEGGQWVPINNLQ